MTPATLRCCATVESAVYTILVTESFCDYKWKTLVKTEFVRWDLAESKLISLFETCICQVRAHRDEPRVDDVCEAPLLEERWESLRK